MSAQAMDPSTVPDTLRLDGTATVRDAAQDALVVERFGDRLNMCTELASGTRSRAVIIPNDCDVETLIALESVVAEIQAFLQTARAR